MQLVQFGVISDSIQGKVKVLESQIVNIYSNNCISSKFTSIIDLIIGTLFESLIYLDQQNHCKIPFSHHISSNPPTHLQLFLGYINFPAVHKLDDELKIRESNLGGQYDCGMIARILQQDPLEVL